MDTTYTIQMASKISGVGVHTIRAWEKRYKALEPTRDTSGHRVYNKSDIEKLILLSELCFVGYAISKVANYSISELKELLRSLGKAPEEFSKDGFNLIKEQPAVQASDSLGILKFALVNLKLDIVNLELGKLKLSISARDFALEILNPLCQEALELKSRGVMSSSQFQVFLQIIKFHSGHYTFHQSASREHNSFNIFFGGIESHSNEFLILMTALLSASYKIQFTFFELNRNTEELIEAVNFLRPSALFLSLVESDSSSSAIIEKIIHRVSSEVEIHIVQESNVLFEKVQSKRIKNHVSIQAIDQYLAGRKSVT